VEGTILQLAVDGARLYAVVARDKKRILVVFEI
jgi:hypothetical protein